MQKKIIALAVAGLVSGGAFAQSNVTISGNIDLGYRNVSNQAAGATGTDKQNQWIGNNSSTTNITFAGTENLGGGLTAGFLLASDFTAGAQQQFTAVSAAAPSTNQMFNSQNYLSLAGGFGTVRFGTVNQTGLEVALMSQPFSTAIGSSYSGDFGRLNGASQAGNLLAAAAAAGNIGARTVRIAQSARYDSPSFSGFQVSVQHAFGNDNDQYSSVGAREFGLKYSNGPINVGFASTKADTGNNVVGTGVVDQVTKHNQLGGNFAMGPATIYGGWTKSKQTVAGAETANASSWNLALKYAVSGQLAVMANVVRVNDKMATDVDRSLTGLGLDYSLSKRTTAYARMESGDNNKSAATGTDNGKFTRWSVGARHAF